MIKLISPHFNKIAAAVAAATLGAGLIPSAVSAQELPPYAYAGGQIQGTIASINSTFNITVRDNNGYLDNVGLHQGTIINPTGLTLEPGMAVTILGDDAGGVFNANEIDTPYNYAGALPVPVYYGPGWWYPGFAYGYGPSFSLVIGNGPYVLRQPWQGHWFERTPLPRIAYRPPVAVDRPGIANRPFERQPMPAARQPFAHAPMAPIAQRPQFAQHQPMPFANRPMSMGHQGAPMRMGGPAARGGERGGGGFHRR